ncbi:MAG: serine/threonine protein kinase, partial [Verrucomicrobiota bacterium]
LVEQSLGRRSNLCRPLTSYINRVYDVEMEDGTWVVVKFYRPGRWSRDALQDEQDFLFELNEREIPVIAPMKCADGQFLQEHHGMHYALFPKKGGRALDEPTPRQWLELGRLLARVHGVGALHPPRDRIEIGPGQSTAAHVQFILGADFVRPSLKSDYEAAIRAVLDLITPLFEGVAKIRIHGDCHRNNIISRPGEPFTLIDFDDMAVGPPVQDLWMLLPGHLRHSQAELGHLLEGYETFKEFDHPTLRLIEPLRAMRFIHFTAWCARQKADGGFARLAPDWGTDSFWKQEIHDLRQQHQEIVDSLDKP